MPENHEYFSSRTEDTSVLWTLMRRRIAAAGIDLAGLPRLQQCLRTRLGQEPPAYADPLQKPEFYIPGLRTHAWYDPSEFTWIAQLEEAHAAIRAECAALQQSGLLARRPEGRGGRWDTGHLFFMGERSRELCDQCPETTRLIEAIPGATEAGLVYFASLAPGTHLEPHCGPTNARLRCHLGLRVPDGCSIRVGADTREWREGRGMVFDDSFEHEVWHTGREPRTVLVLDIWHPDLSDEETRAIVGLLRLMASIPSWNGSTLRPSH